MKLSNQSRGTLSFAQRKRLSSGDPGLSRGPMPTGLSPGSLSAGGIWIDNGGRAADLVAAQSLFLVESLLAERVVMHSTFDGHQLGLPRRRRL